MATDDLDHLEEAHHFKVGPGSSIVSKQRAADTKIREIFNSFYPEAP